MALSGFHPVIARWFSDRLGEPTPAQVHGWQAIRSGADTLIAHLPARANARGLSERA
jgi:ATP-dependent Lhr-like helicase